VTGAQLHTWREAAGWDVPQMARELRKIAKDSGEDVAPVTMVSEQALPISHDRP
jgi:hypothetical protein